MSVSEDEGLLKRAWTSLAISWKAFVNLLAEKRETMRREQQKLREEERLRDEEFERTHQACPICEEQIQKGLRVCPECGAPFADPAALQTWSLQQEVKKLREEAADAREAVRREKQNKRSNNQGCGCGLILISLVVAVMFPPLGGLLFIVGLVMLLVGLVS